MAVDLDLEVKRRRALQRRAPAVAISLAIHAVVFLAAGLMVPKANFRVTVSDRPVEISLLPPMPRESIHRARATTASKAPQLGRNTQATPAPLVHAPPTMTKAAPPSPPNAPTAKATSEPSGVAKPGASYAPGPLPGEDAGPRGVSAFLRGTVGCDFGSAAHLSREEKDRCTQRFANGARKAEPFSGVPPEKLAGFMAEAAANERRRAAHDQNVPMSSPVVACDGAGSNFGTGCLPAEAIHHFKQN